MLIGVIVTQFSIRFTSFTHFGGRKLKMRNWKITTLDTVGHIENETQAFRIILEFTEITTTLIRLNICVFLLCTNVTTVFIVFPKLLLILKSEF